MDELWTKSEFLPERDREARLLELRERRDKPKAKRRKTNSSRMAKGGRLLG
jgi:hypothetical protein